MKILIGAAVAALALSGCSGQGDRGSEPPAEPLPSATPADAVGTGAQPQSGTWVRDRWGGVSDLTGEALYDRMCRSTSEYMDVLAAPARTRYEGEFDRQQFARERVEGIRSDPAWKATFSPKDQKKIIDAVIAAGNRAC